MLSAEENTRGLQESAAKQRHFEVSDVFVDTRRAGRVVGSCAFDGLVRGGVDLENVLSIDNHALRIQPLLTPGWGRAGVAYGPYERRPGLAFAVFMVNGHNTSQSENIRETFGDRLRRWLAGSEVYRLRERLRHWLLGKRKGRMLRQFRWWWRIAKDAKPVTILNENLAVGWFPSEVPANPLTEGNGFVMHATGPENGELWVRVGTGTMPAIRGVQNLQIYYVVLLRERGAAYYVGSVSMANGLGCYPNLRPIGIDPFGKDPSLYAAIYQAALGQIGFRLDTRVYATKIALLPKLASWYGTAHAADRLAGDGPLGRSAAEVGNCWCQIQGSFLRSKTGARAYENDSLALLDPGAPSGLIHMAIDTNGSSDSAAGIIWRATDSNNYFRLTVGKNGCELAVKENGRLTPIAQENTRRLDTRSKHSLQVLDDGRTFSAHLNGKLLFEKRFSDTRLQGSPGIGICASLADASLCITDFEAHPMSYPLPALLQLGEPWWRLGQRVVVADQFEGDPRDLEGKLSSVGAKIWKKTIGSGHIDVMGDGSARIRASVESPSPGRTAYVIDWDHDEFADLDVSITPPGTARGQREHGLCGFIFWQDERNYVTINIWRYDTYDGASISTFFQLDGFEDLYDAIWSNVGDRIYWGKPHRFRVVFDGMHYMAFVDDEPVLYRALTDVYADCERLSIKQVGLLANWEWGTDTGSVFRDFCARV